MLDQHSLTHFPSQLWCKACVESRGRDSHREPSKIDAVVSELQFDYGYIEDGGPLLIARFLVGTDTSSGAIHATMVPDSKRMDMHFVVAGTAKRVLRHMDDVVGTGPEEHLMSDFKHMKTSLHVDGCGFFAEKQYRPRGIPFETLRVGKLDTDCQSR